MPEKLSTIAILLGSRNGESFLQQQLDSFTRQTYKYWQVYASDDGSTDSTRSIIDGFLSTRLGEGFLCKGPQKGFAANFMSLVGNKDIQANYYAFSDQDDVWHSEKLACAVSWLNTIDDDTPALYCSRTVLIDEDNKQIGLSPDYRKKPGFGNALLQNIASGNTMVFNHRARQLLAKAENMALVAHDWSLYQIVTACGGIVHFDSNPRVYYRQHGKNTIGNGMSPLTRLSNFVAAHKGRSIMWNDRNNEVLKCVENDFTQESKQMLASFKRIRDNTLMNRFRLMSRSGIYHQQLIGRVTTFTYVLLNKI
ncbi:TPA: glycosyltransferase [Serratia marcescens]|nr:glycosyltransferase [Serratia marcescens]